MVEFRKIAFVAKSHGPEAELGGNLRNCLVQDFAVRRLIAKRLPAGSRQYIEIAGGAAASLIQLGYRFGRILVYFIVLTHFFFQACLIIVRPEDIPDECIRHIAGVGEHQRRRVRMKACVVSVYLESRHYLQLKASFHRNVETDILRRGTIFPDYPRLYLQCNPRRL